MNADEKCILLAERIVKILREGIHINSDVMHFIDSTFSNPCINELEKIIVDDSDCERDSLIELIFFPDEEIQAKLEDLLESHNYCREDEKKVLDCLSFRQIESTIHFPDNKGAFSVKMPYEAAGRFLARLNIHRNIDEKISAAIDKVHYIAVYMYPFPENLHDSFSEQYAFFIRVHNVKDNCSGGEAEG